VCVGTCEQAKKALPDFNLILILSAEYRENDRCVLRHLFVFLSDAGPLNIKRADFSVAIAERACRERVHRFEVPKTIPAGSVVSSNESGAHVLRGGCVIDPS
jgi:hypothetical protein